MRFNRKTERYAHVKVCERWHKFENFLADMGERPDGTTLDRIKGEIGYEPGNCRWATPAQQSRNRKSCKFVTLEGKTLTLKEWARELQIPSTTLYRWHAQGKWPFVSPVTCN
jgi:hypothetical protein